MAHIFGEKGKYEKYSLAEQQELGAKFMYQINQNEVT